jgi:hypothetical protein
MLNEMIMRVEIVQVNEKFYYFHPILDLILVVLAEI